MLIAAPTVTAASIVRPALALMLLSLRVQIGWPLGQPADRAPAVPSRPRRRRRRPEPASGAGFGRMLGDLPVSRPRRPGQSPADRCPADLTAPPDWTGSEVSERHRRRPGLPSGAAEAARAERAGAQRAQAVPATVARVVLARPAVSGRLLDPLERTCEILFGVIVVLTFTGSISVATGGAAETRTILVAAIGCNLAWGIVDAAMYLMSNYAERTRAVTTLRAARRARDPESA